MSEENSMTGEEQRHSGKIVGDKRNIQRFTLATKGNYLDINLWVFRKGINVVCDILLNTEKRDVSDRLS